jgi:hypothetical protein
LYTLRLPGRVQRSEEIASGCIAVLVARDSIAIQLKAFTGGYEQ